MGLLKKPTNLNITGTTITAVPKAVSNWTAATNCLNSSPYSAVPSLPTTNNCFNFSFCNVI